MRRKSVFFGFLTLVIAGAVATGCDQKALGHFDNKIFVSVNNAAYSQVIPVDATDAATGTLSRTLNLAMAKYEDREVKATVGVGTGELGYYKTFYGDKNATLLPSDYYTLTGGDMTIKAGQVTTEAPVTVAFSNLDQLPELTAHTYVLPVTISSASIDMLSRSTTMYYVIKKASLINTVVGLGNNMRLYPGSKTVPYGNAAPLNDLTKFTLEALVMPISFAGPISTIMGVEERFIVRMGDVGYTRNSVQLAYSNRDTWLIDPNLPNGPIIVEGGTNQTRIEGKLPNSDGSEKNYPKTFLPTGKWSHVAATFDEGIISLYINGELVITKDETGNIKKVSFGKDRNIEGGEEGDTYPQPEPATDPYCVARFFFVGYSADKDRPLGGNIAEVRIWNKALTADEINADNKAHWYKVAPDSDGLVAYWRCNDGSGSIIKDYTVNANHMIAESTGFDSTAPTTLDWLSVNLPE